MISGNDVAGDIVIAIIKVKPTPMIPETRETIQQESLEIFPSCVKARAQARNKKGQENNEKDTS